MFSNIQIIKPDGSTDKCQIEIEPLSAEAMNNTFFIVSASNQSTMGPVTTALAACWNFQTLFSTPTSECGVKPTMARGVAAITATFTWSGKKHRIRKERQEDWLIFCNVLQKAWDSHSDKFVEGCEVEMLIHI